MIPPSPLIGSLFSTDPLKEIPLASQIINETTGPLVQLRFARKKGNYISQKIKKYFSKLNLFFKPFLSRNLLHRFSDKMINWDLKSIELYFQFSDLEILVIEKC